MSQTDRIRAIIAEHVGTGLAAGLLESTVRSRMAHDVSQVDVDNAVGFCRDIMNAVPVLIDRVREAADANGLTPLVEPVLQHAETYFVSPIDVLPEALFGETGLLDDAYLALSVITLLQTEDRPLLEIDLRPPLSFIEQLLDERALEILHKEKENAFEALLAAARALASETDARRPPAAMPLAPPARPSSTRPSSTHPTSVQRRQCGTCSGHGTTTCSSCGGYGSHTVSSTRIDWQGRTEHVTRQAPCSCAGGRTTCHRCGGAGFEVVTV
jgi:uncharacterized membrane protein YkvA (DUF1232 family)